MVVRGAETSGLQGNLVDCQHLQPLTLLAAMELWIRVVDEKIQVLVSILHGCNNMEGKPPRRREECAIAKAGKYIHDFMLHDVFRSVTPQFHRVWYLHSHKASGPFFVNASSASPSTLITCHSFPIF